MHQLVSKTQFQAQILKYLKDVEEKKQSLVITHRGKPVVKLLPYTKED